MADQSWSATQMTGAAPTDLRARELVHPVSGDQLLVTYVSDDGESAVDLAALDARVARDATLRAADGWRIVSLSTTTLRTRDVLVAPVRGGTFASQVAITVVYRRDG